MSTSGGGGGGTSNAVPIANSSGVTIDMAVDPVTNTPMRVVTFPGDQSAIAFVVAGNSFPSWLFTSAGGDGMYIGDGTFDPYGDDGANLFYQSGMQFAASKSGDQMTFTADGQIGFMSANGKILFTSGNAEGIEVSNNDLTFSATDTGPVVPDSTDGHTYRLITTAGVVGSEQVT